MGGKPAVSCDAQRGCVDKQRGLLSGAISAEIGLSCCFSACKVYASAQSRKVRCGGYTLRCDFLRKSVIFDSPPPALSPYGYAPFAPVLSLGVEKQTKNCRSVPGGGGYVERAMAGGQSGLGLYSATAIDKAGGAERTSEAKTQEETHGAG